MENHTYNNTTADEQQHTTMLDLYVSDGTTEVSTEDDVIYAYDYSIYELSQRIYPVHNILLVVFGLFGNTLALVVILQPSMRGVSSAIFVATLAVFDSVTLIGFLLKMLAFCYLPEMVGIKFCISQFFLSSFGSMTSAWTVVLMTLERALIITFPLKAPSWTNRTKAAVSVLIIIVVVFLLNIHFFFTLESDGYSCDYKTQYNDFKTKYTLFDSFMAFYIPVILVLFFNVVIIIQMKRARNFQKKLVNSPSEQNGTKDGSSNKNSTDVTHQITVMLLSVSITFFLCMTPYSIFQIYAHYIIDQSKLTIPEQQVLILADIIAFIPWEINHSINVVLYSLTGRKFRRAMLNLFTCGRLGVDTRPVTSTTNLRSGATSVTSVKTITSSAM